MKIDSSEFKKLQSKWYKKLEKSGFEDIEDTLTRTLKDYHGTRFYKKDTMYVKGLLYKDTLTTGIQKDRYQEKATYFQKASQWYITHNFKTEIEKVIWQYHSEGMLVPEFMKKIKGVSRWKISAILRDLVNQFKEDICNAKI